LRRDELARGEVDCDHVIGRFRGVTVRGRKIFDAQLLLGDDDSQTAEVPVVVVFVRGGLGLREYRSFGRPGRTPPRICEPDGTQAALATERERRLTVDLM
jgi:hypothetical protein